MGVIKGFFGFDVFKEQPNFSLENFHDICWGLNFGPGLLWVLSIGSPTG